MIPSPRRVGHGKRAVSGCHAVWLVLACCVGMTTAPAAAQVPMVSREELMRQWDVDRDGKVDASEAEIARGRMRRARTDAMMNSGNDPVTGKPRTAIDPVTGRPVPSTASAERGGLSTPASDDGLILVPGTGERPDATGNAGGKDNPPRPPRREREALPGTRAPSMSSTIPSVTPRLPTGGSLPGASPGSGTAAGARPPGARPGIIAGGTRADMPGARPSSGVGGRPPGDLNAGRLPGGLPQARGVAPGTVSGPRLGPMQQSGAGRLAGPGPSVPRPGIGPYRGATSPGTPGAPSAGMPSVPQPGMRQPDGGRPITRTPNTVPRVPRMSTDEFYGR